MTTRRVTGGIMRRPERLTALEHNCLDEMCGRNTVLATAVQFARRLTLMMREHLVLDVWIADVRLDGEGERELRTLAGGMRRDQPAIQDALTATYTSGAVEGNVTRIRMLKRQMYGRANFGLLRRRTLLGP
ncbi:transposase [Streptomyces albidoflavus]